MNNKIDSKEKLIEYLSLIRDAETKKPLNETDTDLIDVCVKLLLELQDKKVTLTPKKIEEAISALHFTDTPSAKQLPKKNKRKKHPKKKFFLIAAVITTAVTACAIGSGAFERTATEMLKERFGSVQNAPEDVVIHEDNVEFGRGSNSRVYESFEDMARNEDVHILVPAELPKGTELTSILFGEYSGKTEINICFNDASPSCTVLLNQKLPPEVLKNESVTVNGFKCYVEELKDIGIVQIYFSHNNNTYIASHTNKQTVFEIIEKLEEVQ